MRRASNFRAEATGKKERMAGKRAKGRAENESVVDKAVKDWTAVQQKLLSTASLAPGATGAVSVAVGERLVAPARIGLDGRGARAWCDLDLARLLDMVADGALAKLSAEEREARVVQQLQGAVHSPLGSLPTVDCLAHAVMPHPAVVSAAPASLVALAARHDAERALTKLLSKFDKNACLPYADPGWSTAVAIATACEGAQQAPRLVALANGALHVGGPTPSHCLKLLQRVAAAADESARGSGVPLSFSWVPEESSSPRGSDGVDVDIASLRGALARAGWPVLVRADRSKLARRFAGDREALRIARRPLSAAAVSRIGREPLVLPRSTKSWQRAIESYHERHGEFPRVVVQPDAAVYVAGKSPLELRSTSEVLHVTMTATTKRPKAGLRTLTSRQLNFVTEASAGGFHALDVIGASTKLAGRVALVTGAASGLGKGIARGLINAGCVVVAGDVNAALLDQTSREFPPGRYLPAPADVTSESSVAEACALAVRAVGGIDILVNAAGIAPSFPLVDFPLGAWQKTLDINLTGYFLCAREAAKVMIAQDAGGSIINITSKSGLEASKLNSAYNATKAGEIHLMRGWAMELGPAGIRVNCVAPGNVFKGSQIWNEEYIKAAAKKKGIRPEEVIPYYTSLSPLGKEIEPDDIANSVLYLVTDEGSKVTGQTIVVDGGQVMVR